MITFLQTCEQALLERFVPKAMALWAVRGADQDLPLTCRPFSSGMRRMNRTTSNNSGHARHPVSTDQRRCRPYRHSGRCWRCCCFGYEALGLEFASLLAGIRPDLSDILDDERFMSDFSGGRNRDDPAGGGVGAQQAARLRERGGRFTALSVDRYLKDPALAPYRTEPGQILSAIGQRFVALGLLAGHDSRCLLTIMSPSTVG